MKLTKKMIGCVMLLILVLSFCLAGCTAISEINENTGVEELVLVLTEEDFVYLEDYPDLKRLDLSGSTCYDAIIAYQKSHPEVEVIYTVSLCGEKYAPDITELTLEPGSFDLEAILETLRYLPEVTTLNFPGTALTDAELNAIRSAYPQVAVEYSLELLGQVLAPDVTELNLAGMTSDQVAEAAGQLPVFTAVTYVELMDEKGECALSLADVKALQDALPGALFNYSFEFYGQTLSTSDETVEYYDVHFGNESEADIRMALDVLANCTYFKLDNCDVDSVIMASIRDDYPDVKVVWRIWADKYTMCTDETMIRMTFNLDNEDIDELKYCTDVTHMDIGHNSSLTDISFVEYMTKLECVIVSGSPLTDISYFEDHDSLIWLELCFCGNVEDLSVLATCDNLTYLNVSYSRVSDLSALEHLPLERFNCMHTKVSSATEKQFKQWHPNCISIFEGKQPYGYGWRYNDHGYTFFEYYVEMREIFRYAEEGYGGNEMER